MDLAKWARESIRLADAISRHWPDIPNVEPLGMVGKGFRSLAVETASGVLFRIGKSDEAVAGFALEMGALPLAHDWQEP